MASNIIESKLPYDGPKEGTNMSTELLAAFRKHSKRTLLVNSMTNCSHTGGHLLDTCGRIAQLLRRKLGLKVGDLIMTMCDHTDRESLLLLAGLIGGQSVLGTWCYAIEPLQMNAIVSKPSVLATSSALYEKALEICKHVPAATGARIILMDAPDANGQVRLPPGWPQTAASDHFTLQELIDSCEPLDEQFLDNIGANQIDWKQHASLNMITSGTTGLPKMIPWTHYALAHDLLKLMTASKYSPLPPAKAKGALFPLTKDDVIAGDLPIDQGAGVVTMLWSIMVGAKFVIMQSFDVNTFWKTVAEYRITTSLASTTFGYKLFSGLKKMIEAGKTGELDLTCFRFISFVGCKLLYVELIREVQQVYSHITVSQFYGSNEIGFISMVPIEESDKHLDSAGYLMPDIKAKVVDPDTGECLGPNQRGELHLWSHCLFKRYALYDCEDELSVMAEAFSRDGFYRTNDLTHYDEEQRFYVHGRMRETLTLDNDWKLLPCDFEDVIDKHPLVDLSVVVGIPNVDLPGTDAPRAFVKLINEESDKFKLLQDDSVLKDRLMARDNKFIAMHIYETFEQLCGIQMRLRGGVRIVDKFPTTGQLEKINRKALKALP